MAPAKFMREPDVLDRVPFSKPTLHRKVKERSFPAPVKVGARAVAWITAEIDEWERRLVAERDARLALEAHKAASDASVTEAA
jgi:prophage regulatory protein